MGEYVPKHIPERIRSASRREPLKPLHLTQPEGVSFTLDGNLLQWQNWSLRIGFNHREGMTLHTIRYRDGDRTRSVAHRISLAEMIVPYRDSSEDHYRRTAFDIGEWGLGFMTTSLELGCDCLGEIRYLDAVLHNSKGEPYTITNADLHPRGRQRRAVEARRPRCGRRGATHAPADDLVPRHRRQLRVPRLLAALPGRQHRVRDPRHRHHGDHSGGARGSRIRTARWSTSARMRRSTNTFWWPGSTSTSTAATTRSTCRSRTPSRWARTTRTGCRWCCATCRCAPKSEGKQDVNFATQRSWKVVNTNVVNGLGTHPSYKLVPDRRAPDDVRPRLAGVQAGHRHRAHICG